jgi:hypothetical protein
MIWLEQEIEKDGQTLLLRGVYNPPDELPDNIIEIRLVCGDKERVMFTHNPSMMVREEPDMHDIHMKYANRVQKYLRQIALASFDDLKLS